jgi:hypothetical protein
LLHLLLELLLHLHLRLVGGVLLVDDLLLDRCVLGVHVVLLLHHLLYGFLLALLIGAVLVVHPAGVDGGRRVAPEGALASP